MTLYVGIDLGIHLTGTAVDEAITTITFRADGVPVPQPRPRTFWQNGKAVTISHSARSRNWCNSFAVQASAHRPRKPLTGPLSVELTFTLPDKRRRDLDNLAKLLLDTLTRLGFWEDDSQVMQLTQSKSVGPAPGVTVCIQPHRQATWEDKLRGATP